MRQAIETHFIGPTDQRGSRVKATCQAGSVTLPWDYKLGDDGNHIAAARELAAKLDWRGPWYGGSKADGTDCVFVNVTNWHGDAAFDIRNESGE